MIRPQAAENLARNLLTPYLNHGLASEETVNAAAALILTAVAVDEATQNLERLRTEALCA